MLIVLTYSIFAVLGAVLLVALYNVIAGPRLKDAPESQSSPRVSIMVPARNEEHNVERCIHSLMQQDYADFQVLALDDHSTDRTKHILDTLAGEYSNLQVLTGVDLPADWTGKNWACHQLSEHADGDIFIFTDADNWHAPDAVRK
jgi:chlorobactene glucosyltransferase